MWVAWLTAAAALQTRTVLLRSPSIRMSSIGDEQPTFTRGIDLLQTSDAVTARQIVNVLGRWGSHRDWNEAIGRKGKLDELRSGDFYDDDVQTLKTDFSQPMEYYIPRRPQFLNFCERYGLVARWVHGDNVGELPFTDAKLAASIGATVDKTFSLARKVDGRPEADPGGSGFDTIKDAHVPSFGEIVDHWLQSPL